jgi:hypothetical protein
MKLSCRWCRRALARVTAAETGIPPSSWTVAHVARCAGCRAEWERLRRLAASLQEALPVPAAGDAFSEAIWSRIDRAPAPRRIRRPALAVVPIGAVASLAAVLVAVSPKSKVVSGQWSVVSPNTAARRGGTEMRPPGDEPHSQALGVKPWALRTYLRAVNTASGPRGSGLTPYAQRLTPTPLPHPHTSPNERQSDSHYLDGRDPDLLARWTRGDEHDREKLAALLAQLPPPADDFVQLPVPSVADTRGGGVTAAVREYERQAKVIDARLFRKVTVELKGAALSELCRELKAQTGVELRAARGVEDEKVTVFVKEQPARDVMRAVARLFGDLWARSGEEGSYRYELVQDLKSQLVEEELRNADLHAALIGLDQEMGIFRPFLDMSWDELHDYWRKHEGEQRRLFRGLFNGGWAGMQLYHRLSPEERGALVAGQELVFRPDAPQPERRLSPEWNRQILQSWDTNITQNGQGVPLIDVPGVRVSQVRLKLDRAELGEVALNVGISAEWPENGWKSRTFIDYKVATGKSPSVATPDNAAANAALRGQPRFQKEVALKPVASCPELKLATEGEEPVRPHVTTADVWETIHRETGLPIVADYFTRLYPQAKSVVPKATLFDALCKEGDLLGVRWKLEGELLLCRSTSFFWDKLKEVPNRLLLRWQASRREHGGLPLADLLEMATLSDQQLGSAKVAEAIQHCWSLPEWRFVGGGPLEQWGLRPHAQFMAQLTEAQRQRVLEPNGLPASALTPAQQRALFQLFEAGRVARERQDGTDSYFDPRLLPGSSFRASYVPAGWYLWEPPQSTPQRPWPRPLATIAARTAEAALAAARQGYPAAQPSEVTFKKEGWFSGGIAFTFPAQ